MLKVIDPQPVDNPGPSKGGVDRPTSGHAERFLGWALAGAGLAGLAAAAALRPVAARSAASQDWPPFVLVAGLLLIGLVADDDGLFAAVGHRLARSASSDVLLFIDAVVMVGAETAVLNLDTSVAFLTPILVYAARSRGEGEAPLLYGYLLLANAGSLFLPGSNLTNLIVLGHLHLSGGQFRTHMWAPALASLIVTTGCRWLCRAPLAAGPSRRRHCATHGGYGAVPLLVRHVWRVVSFFRSTGLDGTWTARVSEGCALTRSSMTSSLMIPTPEWRMVMGPVID